MGRYGVDGCGDDDRYGQMLVAPRPEWKSPELGSYRTKLGVTIWGG